MNSTNIEIVSTKRIIEIIINRYIYKHVRKHVFRSENKLWFSRDTSARFLDCSRGTKRGREESRKPLAETVNIGDQFKLRISSSMIEYFFFVNRKEGGVEQFWQLKLEEIRVTKLFITIVTRPLVLMAQ